MIDTTVLGYTLFMEKRDTDRYPQAPLPEGYRFAFYQKGDEEHWADLVCSVGFFKTREIALENFRKDFLSGELRPEDRMLFVIAPDGEYAATLSLWDGTYLGEHHQRLHWLTVRDSHAGRGLAGALITRLLDLYRELGYRDFIYLITSCRYYPAVAIYRRYGFTEYRGSISPIDPQNDDFTAQNAIALETVEQKLAERRKKKEDTV